MNEILRSLRARKSVRAYEERPIGPAEKQAIIEAAIQAPTAGNQALYTILDIQDQGIKEELARLCDDQPFIATAPLVLVFLADNQRWLDAYAAAGAVPRPPLVGDLLLAMADALIAAQNAVVAAESLGIGSCYIGDILENKEKVAPLLGLEGSVVPAAMLVFGYPTGQQAARTKPPRFHSKYLLRKDRYSRLPEEEIRRMFAEQRGTPDFDFDKFIRAFCERKYMSAFSLEMSRSALEYLRPYLGK